MSIWNLEKIPDADTQGVIFALLSNIIMQSIDFGPTIVVFDEVWAILKSEAGAHLVETLYRTVRKMGSCIWTISQSINDYVELPPSTRSSILSNSDLKFFLPHKSSEIDVVGEVFKLNERERHLLHSLEPRPGQYSEILCFIGPRRQVWRHVPTPLEYWCATSHPTDVKVAEAYESAHPEKSCRQVLEYLAAKYPNGAIHVGQAA
jgi:conjugal transfer ATP-binding protein TraC